MQAHRKEQSFGCVVVCRGQEDQFLLVRQLDHWGFPKGHPENGESMIETARREVMEECSVAGLALAPEHMFTEKYSFNIGETVIEKENTYFLAFVSNTNCTPQPGEILECGFFSAKAAHERLSYEGAKHILAEAERILSGLPKDIFAILTA